MSILLTLSQLRRLYRINSTQRPYYGFGSSRRWSLDSWFLRKLVSFRGKSYQITLHIFRLPKRKSRHLPSTSNLSLTASSPRPNTLTTRGSRNRQASSNPDSLSAVLPRIPEIGSMAPSGRSVMPMTLSSSVIWPTPVVSSLPKS